MCDKGYAGEANREVAREAWHCSRHSAQGQRTRQTGFLRQDPLQGALRVKQGVGRLKRFERVALGCEKTARNFGSIVSFAAGLCLIKFVHTA